MSHIGARFLRTTHMLVHRGQELNAVGCPQVTTHSKLLSDADMENIGRDLGMVRNSISHFQLQAFPTEHQFSRRIR